MINYLIKYPGHQIWKIEISTQELSTEWNFQKEGGNTISFEKNDRYWYCSALNKESASKQFEARAKRLYEKIKPNT